MNEYKILDINVNEPILPEHIVIKEEVILPETETETETEDNNDSTIPEFQLEFIKEENLDNSFEADENDPLATESTPDLLNGNFCYVSLHRGINREEILSCKICKRLRDDHKWRCSFIEEGSKYKYGFFCQECNKKILTQKQYIQHMSSAHNIKKSHECDVCTHGLKRLITLNAHQCAKNKNQTYKCLECSQMLQQQISLKFHLFIHAHNKSLGHHLKKKEESQKWIQCEKCKKKFSTMWHLKRHQSTFHSTQKYYQCFVCQGTFKLRNLLQIHLQDHLKINKTDNIPVSNDVNNQDEFQGEFNEILEPETNILPSDGGNFKIEWQGTEDMSVPYCQSELLETNDLENPYIDSQPHIIENSYSYSESNVENPFTDSESDDNIPLANLNEV